MTNNATTLNRQLQTLCARALPPRRKNSQSTLKKDGEEADQAQEERRSGHAGEALRRTRFWVAYPATRFWRIINLFLSSLFFSVFFFGFFLFFLGKKLIKKMSTHVCPSRLLSRRDDCVTTRASIPPAPTLDRFVHAPLRSLSLTRVFCIFQRKRSRRTKVFSHKQIKYFTYRPSSTLYKYSYYECHFVCFFFFLRVPTDQILTVLSLLPLAMNLPSALKQTEGTLCWRWVSTCNMEEWTARTHR